MRNLGVNKLYLSGKPIPMIKVMLAIAVLSLNILAANSVYATELPRLSSKQVAELLAENAEKGEFPNFINVPDFGYAKVSYTLDESLHEAISKTYKSYKPDYASFVAIDPDTGELLALSTFTRDPNDWQNLALGANFPAASIFKIITAAAALDQNKVSPETVIPYNGKSTTLYKRQTLAHKETKYTRRIPLKEAFAKSTNPIFGRLGARIVGKENMLEYVRRFGFDQDIGVDLVIPQSRFLLPLEDEWELAEAGSGYTRDIRIGPLHAATMMATIMNSGYEVQPHVVSSISDSNTDSLYQVNETSKDRNEQVLGEQAAQDVMKMMRETVRIGSARKSFRRASRYSAYKGMKYGGKTGSLTGDAPKGRYDWFVGYAEKDGKRIAYASLIINKEKWYVKSARVAFEVLNNYFKTPKVTAKN